MSENDSSNKTSLRYDTLGASASKQGLHDILDSMGALSEQPNFCQLVEDIAGFSDHRSFIHCDGAGTKTIIPYLWQRETGSSDYYKRLAADALVMNLDDVYCLGKVKNLLLANAIARNSSLINGEALQSLISGYYELGKKLSAAGIPIQISGGETADCGDTVRTLIADATLFGRILKADLIDPRRICPGDVIVSFSSSGQASYEKEENSGIGSNGLTLARHSLLSKEMHKKYPEIGDPSLDPSHLYQGPFSIQDAPADLGMTMGNALSSPTRTFSPILHKIYNEISKENIHAVIHLTGGAHSKVLRFAPECRIVKDNLITPPPIFNLIKEHGRVTTHEMYRVFNMGQRMDIYCSEEVADQIIKTANSFAVHAQVTGHVEEHTSKEVLLKVGNEEIRYSL